MQMTPDGVIHVVPGCEQVWDGTVLHLLDKHPVNTSGPNLWENWLISLQGYFQAQLPTTWPLLGV